MKKNVIIFTSVMLNIVLIITLCLNIDIFKQEPSIKGTYQCQEYANNTSFMTFAFALDKDTFIMYNSTLKKNGTYEKSDDKYALKFEDETYFISLDQDSFMFPIQENNTTFVCKFIKVGDVPMYQEFH